MLSAVSPLGFWESNSLSFFQRTLCSSEQLLLAPRQQGPDHVGFIFSWTSSLEGGIPGLVQPLHKIRGPSAVHLSALPSSLLSCHSQGPKLTLKPRLSHLNFRQQERDKKSKAGSTQMNYLPLAALLGGHPQHVYLYLTSQCLVTQSYAGARDAEKFSVLPLGTLPPLLKDKRNGYLGKATSRFCYIPIYPAATSWWKTSRQKESKDIISTL